MMYHISHTFATPLFTRYSTYEFHRALNNYITYETEDVPDSLNARR